MAGDPNNEKDLSIRRARMAMGMGISDLGAIIVIGVMSMAVRGERRQDDKSRVVNMARKNHGRNGSATCEFACGHRQSESSDERAAQSGMAPVQVQPFGAPVVTRPAARVPGKNLQLA